MRIIRPIRRLVVPGLALLAFSSVWLLPPSQASAQEANLPLISIAADQTNVAEGGNATFTLTRSGSASAELTVRIYSIEFFHPDGSGSLDNPTGQYHQVNFAAGSNTATLTVAVDFDGVPESSDSLNVLVSPEEGSAYRSGDPSQASVAITDVARDVTIAADQTTVTEGDTATFTLTRTGPTTKAVVVNISVTDPGSFLRGNHWRPDPVLPTEATFDVGSSTATISLSTKDDLRDIPDNSLTVTVNSGTGYSTVSGSDSASVTVTDNDVAPTLHLSIDSNDVEEGETLTIRVQLTGGSQNPVEYAVVRGYEGETEKYYSGFDGVETAASWSAVTDDNDLDEIDRVYRLEIVPAIEVPEGAQSEYWTIDGPSSVSATVRDNDLPLVWIEPEAPSFREFGFGWFVLHRVGRTDHDLRVNTRTTQDGHVVNPFWADLLDQTRVYTIDTSSDFESIAWVLAGNDGDEDEGALTIQLLEGTDYRIDPARSSATFRVIDLDPPPILSIEDARVSGSEDSGFIKFTVTLAAEHASRRTVTVDYATTDGTAEAGSDYTETSGVLTFDPLETTGVISVPVNDDNLAESGETFTLTLSNLSNAVLANELTTVSATATIEDNEPTVSVAARVAEVTEGAPVVFDLTRTGSAENELTVTLGVLALGGLELGGKVQSVTFAAGNARATWEHATVDNDADEPDRDVIAALTPSSSGLPETYHVNKATATVTVKDNDLPLVTIAAVGSDQTEGEDVEFTLTRQGVLSDPLTVNVSVTGGDDFITVTRPTTATFATGAATHTLTLTTEDDAPVDDDGEVTVEVTAGSGYQVGVPGSAAVALFDSTRSYPVVSILADKGVVDEGNDVIFTLSRSAYGLDESLTVRVKVSVTTSSPGSLSDGVHVAVSNEEVVFDAGSLTASLVRATVDEVLNDGNSAVWAVIQLGQYSIRPYPGEAVVWVRDDDIPTVTMTPETGEVFENPSNGTEFTVVRTGDTTDWLRIKRVTWQDRRWPEEVLDPEYAAFVEESKIPDILDKGNQDFQPGEASHTFRYEPRGTGPLGTTSYLEILPLYCGDDIPGDCGYRPQYKVGTPKSSTIEVLNRDMGVRVVADRASVDEGDPASFTLHRYGGTKVARQSKLTVRVQVTQNGEFIDGVPPQTVTFDGATVEGPLADVTGGTPEGATTAVVTIPTTNDLVDEANGSITLTILDPDPDLYGQNAHSYETFGTGTFLEDSGWTNVATVEVLDNDVAGFSVADASADEDDGSLQFTVTLPGSTLETSVDWATKEDASGDDPATEGKDYEAASGTLTFAPGDTSKTFTVTLNDDDVKEKDETFTIQLSNPVNAALTDATAIGTIDNDDLSQAVFITLDAGTADGVEEGEDVVFSLERHNWLDGAASQDVARGRLVVGLEIVLEGDFVREPVPATAVFEAGVWSATVTVPTIDDALFEPAGSVSLKLVSQGFGLLSNADPVEADVYDNDMPVSIADAQAGEGDGEITFTISLQAPAVIPVTVDVATVDGMATSHGVFTIADFGRDFEAKIETLTFAVGEQDKQFVVTLVDDRWDEAAESFTVELRNPSYARLQDASATGTILDDDPQMEATLVAPEKKRIDEDTIYPVRFEVQLSSSLTWASERSAYLNWTVTPDTATHGEDYVEAGGSIVIPPGHLTATFEIHLVDDDLFETRNELFTVTLTRERWVLVDPDNSSRIITIKDDEVLSAAVVAANANVVEGSNATFHIWVSGSQPTEDVVVQYKTGGTATSGDDYTAPSGTVTIPVGQRSVPIDIGTTADGVHDPNETLVVTLTDVTSVGRTVGSDADTRTATVTILDQGTLVVSVEGDEGTEGQVLQFTVTLSSTTDAPVEVQWETEQYGSLLGLDERATPGVDYEPGGGTVTIPPGEDNGTILVATTQDNLAENTERFLVKLTGASRVPATGDPENVALGAFSAEGSILDDDVAPTAVTLSATPVTVPENADQTELAITATLNTTTALTEDATVLVTVAGGTATEDEDYTATTVTLVIAAGDLSRTGVLQLMPLDDEIAEGDETVRITGTTDGLDVIPAEVTIDDDDAEPTGITLRVTPNSVREGDGDTVLNVKAVLTGGSRRSVDTVVTLSVEGAVLPADGGGTTTAASADDFSFGPALPEGSEDPPAQITLTIPAGESDATARLTLTLVDDLIVEGDETAQVRGTADGLPVTAAPLTITDNDRGPTAIQLSVTPWDLVEGEGAPVLLVTATLTGGGARTADTQVSLSVHGLSAVAGEDYTAPSNVTLTIPAESLTGSTTLTLTLLDDDISEDNEELEVRGTNADPGLPVNAALIAIDDNDAAPTGVTLTLDKDRVPEDAGLQQLTVTGVLTGGDKRTVDTIITLTVSSVTATDADYTYLPAELRIQSGQAEGEGMLLLVPTDDLIDEDDEILEVRGVIHDPGLTVSARQVVITDNDSAGVTITPTALTVLERRSNSYAVKLNTEPTADVTVAISGRAATALTLSGTTLANDSLTFTPENWSVPQTVTVTAGAVTADTDVTLSHGVSGGDYGSVTADDVVVTVVDVPENQVTIQVGVSVSRQNLAVPEGGSNTYEVVLARQPTGDVTVTVTVDDTANNDVTTAEETLVFTTANWNEPKTVTVRAAEDDDALTDSGVTISHTVGGANYEGVTAPGLTVTITEDDADGVTISPTTLTVAEGDAAGVSYTVVLNSQPAGDVTVTVSGHSGTDLTLSGTTLSGDNELTFTTENWGTAQTVTVKADEDGDAVTDADVTLTHAISSDDDSVYNALANQSVTVTITENDAVGVTIAPTSLTVTEGDATGVSYTVVLNSQPAGDVTVTVSGHSGTDLTLSGTTLSGDNELTFTTENWGTAQTVTVKADEDGDAVTDADVTLAHAISSTDDSIYNALANQSVTVSITEDDADGVTISPTTLTVTEGDASGVSYTVVLSSQPAGDVTVAISGHASTDLSISGTTLSGDDELTFTTSTWDTVQTVTVKAAEDEDAETDADVTLTHAISSTDDSAYDALADQSVTVSITENDAVGVSITPTTLTVAEGDASGVSYTVVLNSQPAGDVTVTVSGHSGTDLTLSSAGLSEDGELTFTTENWGTAQTVTVKAAEDDDAVTDDDVTLTHAISSTDDSTYDALANQSVTVSITENDAVGVSITPTTLTVTEGDASGVSYTVVLSSQPAGDVTVAISGHASTDLSISGTTLSGDDELTFTTSTWDTVQTVTVKAAEDEDAATDADVTLTHAISSTDDSTYDALANQSVTVSITEDDAVGVTINPTTLTVTEGDASGVSYTVVLTSQPAGDVTVTVSGHSGTDLTLSGTTLTNNLLTFTTSTWGTAQTVTVKVAEDEDAVTDADVTLVHDISSTDDSVYNSLADQSVTVSITDNDADGVTISPTTLTVAEGDASGVSYTVVLSSQPAGDVTVAISGHASTDLSISGTTLSGDDELTFTTSTWGTAQTVTVKAAEDEDAVTDADVTLTHAISSTDDSTYDALANQSVTVSITENDAVGVSITPTTLTVTEGDASGVSYTVVLSSQPAGDVTVAISGHASTDLSISGTTLSGDDELTFTTSTWDTVQTVTVKAAEDEDAATDADVTLTHAISSTDDSTYDALANQSVTVSITEDDAVGVTINPTTLTVTEGDASGVSYTVVLTSQPAGDVTVTVSGHSGTDLTLSGTTLTNNLLTFTTSTWGTAQTVTVKVAEDEDAVTDADVTLVHDISSTDDSVYNSLADQSVTVSITDNDADGVTISPTTLTVAEGDASGVSYTVVLSSQPAGDVTVAISGHASTDLSISGTTLSGDDELTFTTSTWGTAQTVTVKAAEDEDAVTDADVTLTHAISSTDDSAYDALADQSVTVSITENDAVGVSITPTTLTVTEGDASGVSYTVVLSSQPAGDVTVAISGHASTDLTLSGTTLSGDNELTFTTENWGTAQTVTVKAAEDDDGVTDADVTLTHAISSTDDSVYNALADQSVTVSITEDDAVGVSITPTTLTVTEGDASGVSYTVVLTSQPAGDVTVAISGHASTDLTLSGTTLSGDNELTFTTENWGTAQTVTVKAAEDEDAVTDADVTLTHAISSTDDSVYNALADQSVTVSITENDAVGVSITPTTLTVTEGDASGVSYTVVLTSQPAGDVTVAISGHASTDLTLSGTTLSGDDELTFTTENWGTAQTVTVKAAEDADAVTDADVTLTHAISSTDDSAYDALADQSVTVSITEDDVVGVTISPTTLTVTEGDASGVSYTVVLTSQPAGDMTVAISGHASTDLTLSGTTLSGDDELTFTTENWGTVQTVTVKAAEDEDAVTDADVTLTHAISSTDDSVYNALADQSVTVSITDNDAVGVTIDPTTLTVNEGDATGLSYTVVLTSQPAGDVTVTISGHDETDLSIASAGLSADDELTFTTENWGTAQTVTVKAAEDEDAVTDADVTLVHAITSTDDSVYNALADQSVTVSITDNDAVGVTIDPTTLTVNEGDATGLSYTVVLTSQPAGDVTVTISGHDETDLSIASAGLSADDELTFTTENWGTAQTVTVKAAEDEDAVTDADVTLTHAISSTDDSAYDALADQSVTVSITENDAVGVSITPTTLTVTEGDASGVSYTVVLTSQPAGDVTVAISGHASTDLTLSGTTLSGDDELTFTTENWGTAQTVTVKAAEDADAVTDADVTLTHAISSTDDSAYDALADQSVTVSITEDDVVGVTISPTTLTVTEGDASGVSYTVVLTSQPAGDMTVAISGHASTDLTLSGTTLSGDDELTFTTENWGTVQTVTVKAAEDEDAVTDADVTLTHAISSTDDSVYNALADQSVTVSITDNDAVGVTIDPTTLTVNEGDATGLSYTVVLTSQPAGDVTVTISGHDETDLSIASAGLSADDELTFTTENWGTAQTVTVKAAEDEDAVTDADVTLVHAITSTDDSVYNALADQSVTVSITDNDAVGVTIDPTTLTVNEGDATGLSYTVVLTSQPAGDVTVTISGHDETDLSIASAGLSADDELTFTTENWGTAQTVTVKAAEDEDAVTDADVTLTHAISSTDDSAYDALADQSVTVSITENDAVGVSITPTTLTVTEGDASGVSYTVVLTSQPAGDVTVAISGHASTDLTLSGTTLSADDELTFTTENWGTAQTVTVKAAEDADAVTDADVTLTHAISSTDDSAYDALADQSVTVSITENHGPTVTVSFEKEVHYTIEGASGVAGVEVLLSAPLQTEVTIPITVLSQSTAAPEDYVVSDSAGYASDPGLTFSPGETFGYVFIRAVLDTIDEETETVVLGFGTLPAGVSEGSPNRSTVEVSDAIQVSFADSTYMVQEGGPGVEVMVRLNKPRNNLRVPLTANGQGGADDSDFTGVPPEVVFKDDETEKTFTFVAMEDSEEENGEMVRLGFGAFSEGMVAIFPDSAMVMIDDSAGAPDSAMVMIDDDAGAPAPRHFSASWPTQTSITLTWFTVETAAEYKLEYRKQGESEWTRISGDFDHLPSTSDHRDAFGVAAGLECETRYEFRVSARGSGETRNDGSRYSSTLFGSYATTSAQTGECAEVERVTNLLVSVEPRCATHTWTPPSGDRDTGYRVERYSYTNNRNQVTEPETLVEQANRIADRYQDCSAEYRTPGAEHVYIVTALDDDPEPDEEGAFGSAYTSILVYGPGWVSEGPLNVRLTHDTQTSRGLAWDAPRDSWLTTVRTARAGSGRQQVTLDPWVTGYRVERHEYRRTEDGGWVLQGDWETLRDETDGDTRTSFTDSEDKGDKQYVYRVWAHNDWGLTRYSFRGDWAFNGGDPGGDPETAEYIPPPPAQQQGGETPSNTPATGAPAISGTPQVGETLTADTSGIEDADGLDDVTYSYQWTAGGSDIDGATGSRHTLSSSEEGQTVQVRVTFTDDADNEETLTSEATVEVTAAPAPLTASRPDSRFQSARHKGADDRPQVIVAFSLTVASFEKTTPSVSLTGAAVRSVRQHEEDGLENAWIFFLDPDGSDDIVFSLVTGRPCDSGGICTEGGTTLSGGVQVTLPGPEEEEQEEAGDDQQTPQSPPAKPTNLTATVNADGHIVLSWTAPNDDSITGYQVLRRRPSEGESALLVYVADTESAATTFTDTGVTAGVTHVYRVKAINAAGLSGWSNYVNPTP